MSSDETKSALSRAFELVEAGRYDEARSLLDPILAADKNNADAWWIYAHAVTSPEDGTTALENVLRINPRYPGAQELLGQARQIFTDKPQIKRVTSSVPAAPPASFPEEFPETDAERTERTTQEQRAAVAASASRRSSPLPLIAVAVVIVVVVAVVVLLLSQGGNAPVATPTEAIIAPTLMQVTDAGSGAATLEVTEAAPTEIGTTEVVATAAVATDIVATDVTETEPVATVQVLPSQTATEEAAPTDVPTTAPANDVTPAATAQVAAESFAAIEQALGATFPIAESGVGQVNTSFGNTLMVTVCTEPGRAMRTLLPQVMNALAKESPALGADVAAIGVRMLNCEANTPLLTIATELASAQAYAGGSLNDGAFAATWKPQENR